ncbi:ABC transporter ATP-binding protein [bacterium]|nr:ABC transporter ATP-binding protein [bacterium]
MNTNNTLLQLENAAKTYGTGEVSVHALKPTTFSVMQGEFLVVLGPSGSGKTTMLNIIGGIDTPTEGQVIFDGQDLALMTDDELTDYRRYSVGFVFQFFNLVPTLTARENVDLVAELVANPLGSTEVLESVGLGDRADHFPSELSGGEQQRVAIARALVKRPVILLADEPTGNLDFETGIKVLKVLSDLTTSGNITVLMVTHNSALAPIANRVVRMRSGEIVSVEVNATPRDPGELQW